MENKILVNDIIVINKRNTGCNYRGYFKFFDIYGLEPELKENFGNSLVDHINRYNSKEKYKCLFKAPDPNNPSRMLYVIQGEESEKIFLISENAIFDYYHTEDSYDNSNMIIGNLIKSNKELQEELSRQQADISALKLKIESLLNENKSKSEPMPPPETGMFGIVKHLYNNTYVPFCVVNDSIVYAEESWDEVKTFDIYGKSEYSEIVRLYKGLKSFDRAKALFDHEDIIHDREQLIWSSKED